MTEKQPSDWFDSLVKLVPEHKIRRRGEQFTEMIRFLYDAQHRLEKGDLDGFSEALGEVINQYNEWLIGIGKDVLPILIERFKESGDPEGLELTKDLFAKRTALSQAEINMWEAVLKWQEYIEKADGSPGD